MIALKGRARAVLQSKAENGERIRRRDRAEDLVYNDERAGAGGGSAYKSTNMEVLDTMQEITDILLSIT